uniref:NADAR domain-containing protein n=1 Tax=Globisporangium ultimum (strain ATCC 200006 / CBS 805.95 / DAOM BR144) TaxID=431595 RepID=K3WTU6_GLOUD
MTSLETSAAVYFYGATDSKYGALSNFHVCEFVDGSGQRFFSSEQYFMKKKQETFDPDNERVAVAILKAKSPPVAKKLGRQVKNYDDQVWNAKRYDFMVDALKLKFGSNDALKELLLSTEQKTLYEASRSDAIWGIGVSVEKIQDAYKEQRYFREHGDIDEEARSNWFGTNLLGKALMETRTWLLSSILVEENSQGATGEEQKTAA